ncbi:MAG TPA: sugar ABC transporter permease [Clostridiaceae bacterium]|nr:sugar ABC transporter permease [Clostridiaceae bacterium]
MNLRTSLKGSVNDSIKLNIKLNVRQYTMFVALLFIWLIFTVVTKGLFITSRNLSNLFIQMCTTGIMACGMVLVMVAGHIDLSVGSVAGTLGAIAAALMAKCGVSPILAIAITLIAGLLIGTWHGFWIAYRGVPAFIVTLSSMTAFKGVTLAVTNGATIGEFSNLFKSLGQGYIPKLIPNAEFNDTSALIGIISIILFIIFDFRKRNTRKKYGFEVATIPIQILRIVFVSVAIALASSIMVSYRGIPIAVLILIGIILIYTFITNRTTFGRHVYAIGGNKEAAKLSGINVKKTELLIYASMGLLTALAAIVFTARLNAATPGAGNLFELDAIASCIIGGTSTMGGKGTIIGAIIGALVMASIDNGMSLMNVNIMYQYMIKGLILLLAVWVDFATKKRA